MVNLPMPVGPIVPIFLGQKHFCAFQVPHDGDAELGSVFFKKSNNRDQLLSPRLSHSVVFKGVRKVPTDPFRHVRIHLCGLPLHVLQKCWNILCGSVVLGNANHGHPKQSEDNAKSPSHAPKVEGHSVVQAKITQKVSHNACTPNRPEDSPRQRTILHQQCSPPTAPHRLRKNRSARGCPRS